jgi:hypothetical protein
MSDAGPGPRGAGLGRYLREAFLFRWNLLLFLGGLAAAAIAPFPDVLVPLTLAGELFYLGGLTAIPRFRAAVDARAHAERAAPESAAAPPQALAALLASLSPAARQRFERLRARCLDMQRLAQGVRGGTGDGRADDIRTPALDRLLWAFLKVLASQQALQRFLAATDEPGLRAGLADLQARLAQATGRKDERLVRALTDATATAQLRLDGHAKAASNAEFLAVELDRIEGKIQAVAELAVSHQDADLISSQVDSVAASLTTTEQAIREINQLTGLGDTLAEPPPILGRSLEREGG